MTKITTRSTELDFVYDARNRLLTIKSRADKNENQKGPGLYDLREIPPSPPHFLERTLEM